MENDRILIVGTQGRAVTSGPGTFIRYLASASQAGKLPADFLFPHSVKGSFLPTSDTVRYIESGECVNLRFLGSWILTALLICVDLCFRGRHKSYSKIWFTDRYSALFCVWFPKLARKSIVLVNDDTRILDHERARKGAWALRALPSRALAAFMMASERSIIRRASLTVSCSRYLTRGIEEYYKRSVGSICTLYQGVKLEHFRRTDQVIDKEKPIRVLFVKNEWQRGGLDLLLQALTKLQNRYAFELTTAGISLPGIQTEIDGIVSSIGYKGELHHAGNVDRDSIPHLFARSHIYCVPSRSEALGVAFLEGLAAGLPVIGTNVGGIPEVLDAGRAGWLVPAENPEAISNAIREIIEKPHERSVRVAHGLEHVKRFSVDKMVDEILEISNFK